VLNTMGKQRWTGLWTKTSCVVLRAIPCILGSSFCTTIFARRAAWSDDTSCMSTIFLYSKFLVESRPMGRVSRTAKQKAAAVCGLTPFQLDPARNSYDGPVQYFGRLRQVLVAEQRLEYSVVTCGNGDLFCCIEL
jgi:hypothetical protein